MEDKFVRELKEGAVRKRLPKAEDLGSADYSSFRTEENREVDDKAPIEREDTPYPEEVDNNLNIEKEYMDPEKEDTRPSPPPFSHTEKEDTRRSESAPFLLRKKEGTSKKDLSNKVLQLHKGRKTVDEIYNILKNQGYSYQEIEEAMYTLVKEGNQSIESGGEPAEDTMRKEHLEGTIKKGPGEETPTTEQERALPGIENEKSFAKQTPVLTSEFAPLFVKIDKYNETIETLGNLKNYLVGMSKLFGLANELERIRASNISALNKMYNRTTETAAKLYSGLLKPKGMKIEGAGDSQVEIGKLDSVISDLNKELSILRDEIDKIKSVE